ncbi:hypothetical protein [Streptococcus sp.]|uniref:hypothetical protein n=1 Tax=Streptococcus sp. TaxID=1306 RepID=UPI00290DC014|nr:hypothetical protein [Streptococcus sp.]MDU5045524.1 hypothetical protein [Streptococcus sp.]
MERRELYLIITLLVISLICILSLSIKNDLRKRLSRYKKQNITVDEKKFIKEILKESIDDYLSIDNSDSMESKIFNYIILPLLFTFFVVRISNIGDPTLNIINNVYNSILLYLYNPHGIKIILFIFSLLIGFTIWLNKTIKKRDNLWRFVEKNFLITSILILLSSILMLFVLLTELIYGSFSSTDIYIPLYYGAILFFIKIIKLFLNEFIKANSLEVPKKIFISIIVIFITFGTLFRGELEIGGAYYFYTTNGEPFRFISKEVDIMILEGADDEVFIRFGSKYNQIRDKIIKFPDSKRKISKEVKNNSFYSQKIYISKKTSEGNDEVLVKVTFEKDNIILNIGKQKIDFVRDGSMRFVEIQNKNINSDISGASYVNLNLNTVKRHKLLLRDPSCLNRH